MRRRETPRNLWGRATIRMSPTAMRITDCKALSPTHWVREDLFRLRIWIPWRKKYNPMKKRRNPPPKREGEVKASRERKSRPYPRTMLSRQAAAWLFPLFFFICFIFVRAFL